MFCVLQIRWLAAIDILFSSSKATCSICTTCSWVLNWKGSPIMMDSLHFKAHKKLYGLTGLVEFFFTAKSTLIVHNIGNNVWF